MLTFTEMTSAGLTIPAKTQMKAFAAWLRPGTQSGYSSLAAAIERILPAPDTRNHPYARAADRMVQKLRKAGYIEKVKRDWKLTGKGETLRQQIVSADA